MQECVTRYRTVNQTSAYCIFELWTEITTREVFEASWHLVSVMTGRHYRAKLMGTMGRVATISFRDSGTLTATGGSEKLLPQSGW